MKGSRSTVPIEWPTDPKTVTLRLSSSFPQTSLREIAGKPPFMRCLLSVNIMQKNGIHTDLPLLLKNGEKKIVLHAWPNQKTDDGDVGIDEEVIRYMELKKGNKIDLIPVDSFSEAKRVFISGCPDSIRSALPAIYSDIIVTKESVVFCEMEVYPIIGIEDDFVRIRPTTLFLAKDKPGKSIPSTIVTKHDEVFKHISENRSVLIFGPPGCGKSRIASSICAENEDAVTITVPSLLSGAYGRAETVLSDAALRKLVILENCEVLGQDEVSKRVINAISELMSLSRVVAITSDVESFPVELNQAGRITALVEVTAPSPTERIQILSEIIKESGLKFTEDDIKNSAEAATGFVGGDLQRLISEAVVSDLTLVDTLPKIKPASLRQIALEVPTVRWGDIGGYEDVKQKLRESVALPLEKPEAFIRLGVRPPRGILLFGPPGCSKTLMAKSVATESKMNFLAVKGPELFSKFVGESEKAVANVFRKARSASPSIIFFDEIDAMATKRGSGADTGSNVTDRVLTQLLTEMDGVSTRSDKPVVVIAATNRPDLLDEALLRPGRFDRLVYVPLPDIDARKEILKVHTSKMRFSEINIDEIAEKTDKYSGAEIAALCREAAMNALRENVDFATMDHINSALMTVKPRTPQSLLMFYKKFESERKY